MVGRLAFVVWVFGALIAAAFGVLLVESDPAPTAGPWYLGTAVAYLALAVATRLGSDRLPTTSLVAAALVAVGLTAAHALVLSAYAYHGLTWILVVLSGVATLLTVVSARTARVAG
jgi:hypothetical protein